MKRCWQCLEASRSVLAGFAWQKLASNCPSGKTTRRFWRLTFISRAMCLWLSQEESEPGAFQYSTSFPARSEQISVTASPSENNSNCKTRSLPSCTSAWYWLLCPGHGMLHRSKVSRPQATTRPSLRRSTVCSSPAETWIYDIPSSNGGRLHRSSSFSPTAQAWPSLRRSTVWLNPAEAWMYEFPSSKGGMSHSPEQSHPQVTTQPSLLRSTACS